MNIKRQQEKRILKEQKKQMIKELGVSNKFFKRNLGKVKGRGYDFKFTESEPGGHKPSLRQQCAILRQMLVVDKEMKEFVQKEIEKSKEKKESIEVQNEK